MQIEPQREGTLIHVGGQLLTLEVRELQIVCRRAAKPVFIDLESLQLADANGIELLKRLEKNGARLIGASSRVATLLQRV